MPLYDYFCPNCGYEGELKSSIAARDEAVECLCGEMIRRKFSPCAIRMPAPDWASFTHKDILAPHNYEKKVWAVKKD